MKNLVDHCCKRYVIQCRLSLRSHRVLLGLLGLKEVKRRCLHDNRGFINIRFCRLCFYYFLMMTIFKDWRTRGCQT